MGAVNPWTIIKCGKFHKTNRSLSTSSETQQDLLFAHQKGHNPMTWRAESLQGKQEGLAFLGNRESILVF